jgi:hypothetical protein
VSVADPCWGDDGDAAWLRRNLLLSMLLLLVLPLFMLLDFACRRGIRWQLFISRILVALDAQRADTRDSDEGRADQKIQISRQHTE